MRIEVKDVAEHGIVVGTCVLQHLEASERADNKATTIGVFIPKHLIDGVIQKLTETLVRVNRQDDLR